MPRRNEYTFIIEQPLSGAAAERLARFLTETLARSENLAVSGTVRALPPQEAGRRPPVDLSALERTREAS